LRDSAVVLFWIAFALTRPFGASAGDLLSEPRNRGALNWGTTWTSAALLAALIALIVYQTIRIRRHPLDPLPSEDGSWREAMTAPRRRLNFIIISRVSQS
jgi:hypothetical protein